MSNTRERLTLLVSGLAVAMLSACGSGTTELATPETFHWTAQPISFTPPGGGWVRQSVDDEERVGVRFDIDRSLGGRISVSEYVPLARRNPLSRLRKLVTGYYTMDTEEARRSLRSCYLPRDGYTTEWEAKIFHAVNARLEMAADQHEKGNRVRAGRSLVEALDILQQLTYSLDEVVDLARITPERLSNPDRFQLLREQEGALAGLPALWVDYLYTSPSLQTRWREVYFLRGNHLFIASYQGPEERLGQFDALVRTINFPEGQNPL